MSNLTGKTRGGADWTPEFVTAINQKTCIGCGRCYKVCPRDVLNLIEFENEDEDYDSDSQSMVMAIEDEADCIGCGACTRVCPKDCYSHSPLEV
ncbi:ferredoxin III, nif-specific [Formivibrio citricus]|uniref:Ferredoxin III n=1 Tax=Formivibrio citricus TaxID=83765 RepID=A0A1I4Z0I3_9NEIS|nr:ferredoxin III, nif-specific [Formivibrio citricus]SFN43469.1 ferredoxin III, nif-specific [Formivibrio citricus]